MSAIDSMTLPEAARIMRKAAELQDPVLWIYAIQADGNGGPIKIGISADPVKRLATLQVGSPEDLQIVAQWPSFPQEEKWLHEAYAGSKIRGEWFLYSLPLWRFLRDRSRDFRGRA